MYRQFFGLRESPFDLTPNPRFLFLSPRHREALSNLRYGVGARKGVTVLLGEAGTGKTTIMRAFLASTSAGDARFLVVDNPALTRAEFYELLARRLGFSAAAATSKAAFLLELESAVASGGPLGRLVLVLDEAQALPPDLLEEVRLLSNIETECEKLVSLVLAGQPELAERLEEPRFQALKQRVALRCELAPFALPETAAYIGGRLRIAGGDPAKIFRRDAVTAIHEASRGIARTISIICDNALIGGFGADVKPVGRDIVVEVCRDFRLSAAAPKPGAQPTEASAWPAPAAAEPLQPGPTPEFVDAPTRGRFFAGVSRLVPRRRPMITLRDPGNGE
jgi:general secretion pathway protein A